MSRVGTTFVGCLPEAKGVDLAGNAAGKNGAEFVVHGGAITDVSLCRSLRSENGFAAEGPDGSCEVDGRDVGASKGYIRRRWTENIRRGEGCDRVRPSRQ